MNSVSDLLNFNQVRSVLTISPSNLPDSVLEGYGLEDDISSVLDRRLEIWRDLTESSHVRSLRMYVKFKAASIVALTAQVFILKKDTDGSNEGQRSDKDGWAWLAEKLDARAEGILAELIEDLELPSTGEELSLIGKSVPSRDPITEPREDVS